MTRLIPRKSVKQVFDYFLVLDFEATCVRGGKVHPYQEIIEFPVAKLNSSTLEVESVFHKYVRPTAQPELSTFCTELTGIIQAMVDDAEPLPQVLASFSEWIAHEGLRAQSYAFVTCGDWDLQVQLRNEAREKEVMLDDHFESWINVKKSFCELTGTFPKGMKDILKHMEMDLQGRQHSGIDDVRNIVEITRWLVRKGHVLHPRHVGDDDDAVTKFGVRFS